MRNRSHSIIILCLLALTVLALSTRLLPLATSQYPYNNDGVTESTIAQDIIDSGHLSYPEGRYYIETHSVITPAYNVLLAFVSSATASSPFHVAQFVISAVSLLTVCAVFVIILRVSGSLKGALLGSLFVCMFGTFAFLTSSTWKPALGMAMFAFLIFAYLGREDRRMFVLEMAILATLPLVHHLATVVAFFAIAYMTAWSVTFAVLNGTVRRRHILDVAVIVVPCIAAFAYYQYSSLDRLDYITPQTGLVEMAVAVVLLYVVTLAVLAMKNHSKRTFAAIPAVGAFVFYAYDYFNPLFPYEQGAPIAIIMLAIACCILIGVAWYGFEKLIESSSRHRSVALGLLLPVIALVLFSVITGFSERTHNIVYRTFDFADLALAIGVGCAFSFVGKKPRLERIVLVVVIAALLVSFPFGYATGALTGVRHDTQGYEVDALSWADVSIGSGMDLESDERLSYDARALFDFDKLDTLPSTLYSSSSINPGTFGLYEEEWSTVGVNDYPNGNLVIELEYIESLMSSSSVLYVGGPSDNQAIIFTPFE